MHNSGPDSQHSTRSSQRSRIANGTATLLGARDERSVYVRRMKEVIAEFMDDKGGMDSLSAAEKSLIRRIAVLTIELEKLETRFAEDPTVGERTLDLYNRTAGNLGRLLERLGIKRVEHVPITIDAYLKSKQERTP